MDKQDEIHTHKHTHTGHYSAMRKEILPLPKEQLRVAYIEDLHLLFNVKKNEIHLWGRMYLLQVHFLYNIIIPPNTLLKPIYSYLDHRLFIRVNICPLFRERLCWKFQILSH